MSGEVTLEGVKMTPVWERKKKRARNILLGIPLTIILVVINIVLIGWVIHILHAIFTDALDHMSLYEWTEHLYFLAKNTLEKLLGAFSISL